MSAKDWSREITAVSPYVQGVSVQVQGTCAQQIPGVREVVENSVTGLAGLPEAAIDTLVSICGLEQSTDPIALLRALRRGIREGGRLVLIAQVRNASTPEHSTQGLYAPQYLASLIVLVSGFRILTMEEVSGGETYLIVGERSALSEVRQPFGVHGPTLVQQVIADPAARSEYYFQVGTLMLQSGDPELAVQCFEKVLAQEPDNAEAHFGLGMTYGTQSRWSQALDQLQRAASLDPANEEVRRWIDLARQQVAATATSGGDSTPAQAIPAQATPAQATPAQAIPAQAPAAVTAPPPRNTVPSCLRI